METYKDVEINGYRFRILRISARDGSWIVQSSLAQAVRGTFDQESYTKAMDIVLNKCQIITNVDGQDVILNIYQNGIWGERYLTEDTDTIDALVEEAMKFNVFPTMQKYLDKAALAKREADEASLRSPSPTA
jgi:hypothetical protein